MLLPATRKIAALRADRRTIGAKQIDPRSPKSRGGSFLSDLPGRFRCQGNTPGQLAQRQGQPWVNAPRDLSRYRT
jgi:hypothetical protein